MNARILRKMSRQIAVRRARYLLMVVLLLSIFVLYLAEPGGTAGYLKWTLIIVLIDAAYIVCCYLMWSLLTGIKSRKLLKTVGKGKITYKFNSDNIANNYADIASTFPYTFIKKCWSTKDFFYFNLANGTTSGLPRSAIGKRDQQKINEMLGSKGARL